MKKLFYYLFAAAMLLAVGCNEDEPTPTPQPDEAIGLESIDYAADSNKVAISYTDEKLSTASIVLTYNITPADVAPKVAAAYKSMLSLHLLNGGDSDELAVASCSANDGTITLTASAETLLEAVYSDTLSAKVVLTAIDGETVCASESVEVEAAKLPITLTAAEEVTLGSAITFEVKAGSETLSDNYTIYVGDQAIETPYTPEAVGEITFYAKYYNTASEEVVVTVVENGNENGGNENGGNENGGKFIDPQPESTNFKNRVLIIEHTGTLCSNCPLMMNAIKELAKTNYADRYNLVEAHYSGYANGVPASSDAATIIGFVRSVAGFPAATFNYWYAKKAGPSVDNLKTHIAYTWKQTAQASAAVRVAANLGGSEVLVEAMVKSGVTQPYRISCWLLEDNIYGAQLGATESWHNYHNHCLRDMTGVVESTMDITGDDLGTIEEGQTAEFKISMPIASNYNKEELSVLVIVSAPNAQFDNKFEVVNTILCPINTVKAIEYNE